MPLYEYKCNECDVVFEEMAPMATADEMDCVSCGSGKTQRMVSSFCSSVTPSGPAAGPACGMGG